MGGRGGGWGGGSSERCLKWGGGGLGSLRDLSKNISKGWVKVKVVRRGRGVLKLSPPLTSPLSENLNRTQDVCAKWRIELNPEKAKVIIFSRSQNVIRTQPALSLYGNLLSYYPHITFLGMTFDNWITFIEHFEEILECCTHKLHRLRKWSTKSGVQVAQPFYRSTNNV